MTKVKNTFRFKTFEELLGPELSLSRVPKLEKDAESHLKECFDKWYSLNSSLEFTELRNTLGPKILTLELLIFNFDEVLPLLLGHLDKGTSLSVHTVLDLLQSLVCDVREDILSYLPRVFSIITRIMETLNSNAESAELVMSAFKSIGNIIFYLNNTFIKGGKIEILLPLIKPLLFNPKKPFVRKFTAQCMAFLIRKIENFPNFFTSTILDVLVDEHSTNHSDAIGKIMSYCLKVNDKLLISSPKIFLSYFDILYSRINKDIEFLTMCFDEMFKDLLMTVEVNDYRKLWLLMLDKISEYSGQVPQELELLTIELFFKNAQNKKLLQCSKMVIQKAQILISQRPSEKVIEIAKLLIDKLPMDQDIMDLMRDIIINTDIDLQSKFEFIKSYIFNVNFELTIKNSISNYLSLIATEEWLNNDNLYILLTSMSDLIVKKYPINQRSSWKEKLANNGINFNFFLIKNDNSALIESLLNIIKDENALPEILWMTLIIIPHIYPANTDDRFTNALHKRINILFTKEIEPNNLLDISALLECLATLGAIQNITVAININSDELLSLLRTVDFGSPLEPIILEILGKAMSVKHDISYTTYTHIFIEKLMSSSHQSRLWSLYILKCISGEDSLQYCQDLEEIFELHETDLLKKEKIICRYLDHLKYSKEMSALSKKITVSYLLGALHINYTSLWKYITKILCTFYPTNKENKKLNKQIADENEDLIWSNILSNLTFCSRQISADSTKECLTIDYCCPQQEIYIQQKFYNGRQTNWIIYRLNLVKVIMHMPELAGRKTSVLTPLLLGVYSDEIRGDSKENMKTRKETFMCLLHLYSIITNVTSVSGEAKCKQLYYKCLSSKQPEFQKSALSVLINYKFPEMEAYKEKMLKVVDKSASSNDMKQMSLSDVIKSHRNVIVPLMTRITVGKLKQCGGNNKKQKVLIARLEELEEGEELDNLLLVLMEAIKVCDNDYEVVDCDKDDIVTISELVKEKIVYKNEWSPQKIDKVLKTMLGLSQNLYMILVKLINKVTQASLAKILRVILNFYDCCTDIRSRQRNSMETEHDDNHNFTVLKPLRTLLSKMVIFYFKKIDYFVWDEDLLGGVTRSVVGPQASSIVADNQTSANTTIQLALLWSEKDHLVHLITADLFKSFVSLLNQPKLKREAVGYTLINIVSSIMTRGSQGHQVFRVMVQDNLLQLISFLGKRVTSMKPYKRLKASSGDSETSIIFKELNMINLCVDYIMHNPELNFDSRVIVDMIHNVLTLLHKSNPLTSFINKKEVDNELKEALEVKFLRALEMLLCASEASAISPFFERMLALFSRMRLRASRSVLSQVISKVIPLIMTVVPLPEYCQGIGEVVTKMNMWNESRLEEMDYDNITETLSGVDLCLKEHPVKSVYKDCSLKGLSVHPELWMYYATVHNCLHLIAEVEEMGPREMATGFLRHFTASLIESKNEKMTTVIFFDHIWPFVTNILKTKDEMCHLAFVSLLRYMLQSLVQCPRFSDISKLLHSELNDVSFFDCILSLAELDQIKGLKKLSKFLRSNVVSEINLREIIKPILFFRLETMKSETHVSDNHRSEIKILHKHYSQACMDTLTSFAEHCPHVMYRKMVEEQMDKIDKGTDVETSITWLVSLLYGYKGEGCHDDMNAILKRLEKHLARKDPEADKHKKAQKSAPPDLLNKKDSEWTLRGVCLQVPIAKAMINIATKLPKKLQKDSVTRVIVRLCGFLKSENVNVRKEAVTTMIEILLKLNEDPSSHAGDIKYLNFVIQTIKSQLSRGFQRHVGLFTCHSIIQKLMAKNVFDNRSVEFTTMTTLTDMYLDEQFLDMAKEKMERHDAEKGMVREAAVDKAYEGLYWVSLIIGREDVLEFLKRIIKVAKEEVRTQKSLNKMKKVLDVVKAGLLKNAHLDVSCLLTLSLAHVNENVDTVFNLERQSTTVSFSTLKKEKQEDMYLYKRPVRLDGYTDCTPKATLHNYSYLVVNFGLTLLNGLAKVQNNKDIDIKSILNPCVDRVIDVLTNVSHKDIMCMALKCLRHIVQVSPPQLDVRIHDVADLLFKIHGTNALLRNKNDQSSTIFYKTLTQFIQRRDVVINHNLYKVLLMGIELDTFDYKRQICSIFLLKAIINRRINEPVTKSQGRILLREEIDLQLIEILEKIRTVSLKATHEKTREEARSAILCYMRHHKNDDDDYISETLLFMLRSLVNDDSDENSQVSACLSIQAIMTEYGLRSFSSVDSIKVVAFIAMLLMKDVNEKVKIALAFIIQKLSLIIDTDKQTSICEIIMNNIVKYKLVDKDMGNYVWLMSTMRPSLKTQCVATASVRFIEIVCEKLMMLAEESGILKTQIEAATRDSDLMEVMEVENIASKEELQKRRNIVMDNLEVIIMAIWKMLDVHDQDQIELKRRLICRGSEMGAWRMVIKKLLGELHGGVRLNAARGVVQELLKYEVDYDKKDAATFTTSDIRDMVEATFTEITIRGLTCEESNVIIINLVYLWNLALTTLEGDVRTEVLRKMINKVNVISNDELNEEECMMKRIAMLKVIAGMIVKTSVEDMTEMDLKKNVMWVWMREERQLSNDKKKKRSVKNYVDKEVVEWTELVSSVGQLIEATFGETCFKELKVCLNNQRQADKRKRKVDDAALAVSNPGKFISKVKRRKISKK